MPDVVIRAEGLGKKYTIGHRVQTRQDNALRDVIGRSVRSILRGASDLLHGRPVIAGDEMEEFWALRNVDFEIKRGEVLGVIGRNGAGKSTLLKILSRITEPSTGRVSIKGRVASLLEVGTGFHGELTGRENVFLNGAILGMPRNEIVRKFDQIVEFSGVHRFLDTPVKRYSSGMYVRLAFSVAAHLEPDILVVDEVLAVGDAEFQKKCLGKMQDAAGGGRTILFVSHNIGAISALCQRALLLDHGRIVHDGSVQDAVTQHLAVGNSRTRSAGDQSGVRVAQVRVDPYALSKGGLRVEVDFEADWELNPVFVGAVIYGFNGAPLLGFNSAMDPNFRHVGASRGTAVLDIAHLPVHQGVYRLSVWLGEKNENHVHVPDAAVFDVVTDSPLPADLSVDVIGSTRVNGRWDIRPMQ